MQNNTYLAFVDYEKAFDKAKHDLLIKGLKQMRFDWKDLRLLNNLYRDQVVAISINGQLSDWVPIEKRAQQG